MPISKLVKTIIHKYFQKNLPSKHSSWWRCLEDILTRLSSSSLEDVLKTSSRRLDQDEYIRLSHTSSEDVLVKTNIFFLTMRLQSVFKTSSRGLQYVFKTSCKNVFKTSSRRLLDVSNTTSRRLAKASSRRHKNVLKTFDVF